MYPFPSLASLNEVFAMRISLSIPTLCALGLHVCAGQNVVSTLPYNFTLSAVNTTLPNANTTGVPLVLGQNGATTGATMYVTSTYASYPYNDYPALALVDNGLRAFTKTGTWRTNATSMTSGGALRWLTSAGYASVVANDYEVVEGASAEVYPLLSAHGFTNMWSLCPFKGGQTNVVFNVSADQPPPPFLGFDPTDCYGVNLYINPIL